MRRRPHEHGVCPIGNPFAASCADKIVLCAQMRKDAPSTSHRRSSRSNSASTSAPSIERSGEASWQRSGSPGEAQSACTVRRSSRGGHRESVHAARGPRRAGSRAAPAWRAAPRPLVGGESARRRNYELYLEERVLRRKVGPPIPPPPDPPPPYPAVLSRRPADPGPRPPGSAGDDGWERAAALGIDPVTYAARGVQRRPQVEGRPPRHLPRMRRRASSGTLRRESGTAIQAADRASGSSIPFDRRGGLDSPRKQSNLAELFGRPE